MLGLPAPPWIVGHRGAAGEALENTLASFTLAVAERADMIELDLQRTADGRLVAFHDWDLSRLGGAAITIEEASWGRLREVELRPFPGEPAARMPELREVLATLPTTLPVNLELKRRLAGREALAAAVVDEIGERPNVLLSSFDWELLAELRRRAPQAALAPIADSAPLGALAAAKALGAAALHVARRLVRPALVRAAGEARLPILAYTVNRVGPAQKLLRGGVSGVFTDFPGRLRRQLRKLDLAATR